LLGVIAVVSLSCAGVQASEDAKLGYEAELKEVLDKLELAQPKGSDYWLVNTVGMADYEAKWKLEDKAELALKHGEYQELSQLLNAQRMILTRAKAFPMMITLHPYQENNTAYGAVKALLAKDNNALAATVSTADSSLNESVYFADVMGETPLKVAIQKSNIAAVEMILEAGADPNAKGLSTGFLPVITAVVTENKKALNLLIDAGADVNSRLSFPFSTLPLISYAASKKDAALVDKLLKLGADPELQDQFGWTPLMEAVHVQHWDSIELLLPHSDPTVISSRAIDGDIIEKKLGRFYPRCNAIYIAEQVQTPMGEKILAALIEKAGDSNTTIASAPANIQTHLTNADVKAEAGQLKESMDEVNAGLALAFNLELSGESDSELIYNVIGLLLYKHELAIINNENLNEEEQSLVQHLIGLGATSKKWHDMLNVFAAGKEKFPEDEIKAWEQEHGAPSRKGWRYNLIIDWIESQDDVVTRDRLYDVLDFFELN